LIVRVRYFASARDLASKQWESLVVPEGMPVDGLATLIMKRHPPLRKLKGSLRYSVNLVVVDGGKRLRDGDEVMVFPPISGG
jgi:molybdopterin synthase sulfur carrier subunit